MGIGFLYSIIKHPDEKQLIGSPEILILVTLVLQFSLHEVGFLNSIAIVLVF